MNIIQNLFTHNNVKASELVLEYWELYIVDSAHSAIRSTFHKITEIYVPQLEIAINMKLQLLNTFKTKSDRYKAKNSDMSGTPAKLIKTIVIRGEKVDAFKWLINEENNKNEKKALLIDLFKE